MIDVSYNMMHSGIVPLLCENMKGILRNLPVDYAAITDEEKSQIKVGFITYSKNVHFYNIKVSDSSILTWFLFQH